jgi:lysophospholipid acyltransferase (LPLAT)-like uncharacterized protein
MPLSLNMKSFRLTARRHETRTANFPTNGNTARNRRYSRSIKEFSRYVLQHNLMIVAYYILRLYFLTIRIESINEDAIRQHLESGNKMITAIWHQRIVAVIGYVTRVSSYQPSVMISKSRDGDLIADVYSRMNFRPIRGSSSRDGKKALAAMVDDLKDHPIAVHVLDGPKGPRGVVKPGLIVMAEQSGAPVVPIYISMSRAWILHSWDRCLIPKPFSKIVIRWDRPMVIPKEMDERVFEEIRLRVQQHMLENQRHDDGRFGWKDLI